MHAQRRNFVIAAGFIATLTVLGCGQALLQQQADAPGATVEAPRFEVDPLWPKPLPNHWLLGRGVGVWADEQDHIWIIHTGKGHLDANELGIDNKTGECCTEAPHVLEFDQAGNLVHAWGGPGSGYEW